MSREKKAFNISVSKYAKYDFGAKMECEPSSIVELSGSDCSFDSLSMCSESSSDREVLNTAEIRNGSKVLEIKAWVLRNRVSQNTLTDLLQTLRKIGYTDLPLSARILLGTSRKKVTIQTIPSGEFLYRGIQNYFCKNKFPYLDNVKNVVLDIGIDGLKIFKNSSRVLWPILGAIVDFPNARPFTIACFSGMEKPWSNNDFLKEFCEEVASLKENGLQVGDNPIKKKFEIRLFCCDSPARAFVSGVQSHTGKNSCSKCDQVGSYKNRRVCFSKNVHNLRSDISFKNRVDPSHHSSPFKTSESILESANFKMVSQFPLDPMHLVDLGVCKKLLHLLVKKGNVTKMNEKISFLSNFVPVEFGRVCRNLDDISNWKATEFRQFLLYIGIFVLKDCINSDLYYHFILLHAGIRLLSCEKSYRNEADVAQQILEEFVNLFGSIYGDHLVSYNVHSLLHLTDCSKQYGPLDRFSAYRFENHMQYLKKLIHKPNKILQQLHLRLEERNSIEFDCNKISKMGSFNIDFKKEKDSYCFSKNFGPIKVISMHEESGYVVATAHNFLDIQNYFQEPLESSSGLGILLAGNLDSKLVKIRKDDIKYKYFCIPHEDKFLLVPILHHLFHEFSN